MRRRLTAFGLVLAVLAPSLARAVQLESLEAGREWRLRALRFRGTAAVPAGELRRAMVTKPRPWFAIWEQHPSFDPVAFRTDLDRIRQLYRSRGYYHARIGHDLELPADGDALVAVIYADEGPPVRVEQVTVTLEGAALPPADERELRAHLPVVGGAIFTEEAYGRAESYLRAYYREHHYARVAVTRRSRVDLTRDTTDVEYAVRSGPPCVFGTVRVEGTQRVDPAVVQRELVFRPGDPFKESLLERSRLNLLALNLFGALRIIEDPGADPTVDVRIEVTELPPRDVRLGVGYDTDEQVRGLASWRHYDFLGGARQLGFTARASFIRRTLAADFLQPHYPISTSRVRLLVAEQEQDEDTYTLDQTRVSPRLEWQPTPRVTVFGFYRFDYDLLSGVDKAVELALPGGAPQESLLSGFGLGVEWNATDDLLDPTRGWVTSATVEPVGGLLGGDTSFVRMIGEGRLYEPLVLGLRGAGRMRIGAADPLTGEIPLFERFYAGGLNSVRGYDRRRVGPLVNDQPIGGRTLVEASVELRHPITEALGGAVFTDAGQVSTQTFDFPFGRLRYGVGFGLRYKSPVGPLRVDLGFPLEPPPGDQRWQIHVSLGQTF